VRELCTRGLRAHSFILAVNLPCNAAIILLPAKVYEQMRGLGLCFAVSPRRSFVDVRLEPCGHLIQTSIGFFCSNTLTHVYSCCSP